MNRTELAEQFDKIKTTLDNLENETKNFELYDFMAIMSTVIDIYAKNHNMSAMAVWSEMYETARKVNEKLPL